MSVLLGVTLFVLPNLALAALGILLLPDRRRAVVVVAAIVGLVGLGAVAFAYTPYLIGKLDDADLLDLLGLNLAMWALPVLLAVAGLASKHLADRALSHRAVEPAAASRP